MRKQIMEKHKFQLLLNRNYKITDSFQKTFLLISIDEFIVELLRGRNRIVSQENYI